MIGYVARRLVAVIPVLGVVALFVFLLLYLAPGDPATFIAGESATAEQVAAIRHTLGLDQSFAVRFGSWVSSLLRGDLGTSIFANQPVLQMILERVEPTLSLAVVTLVLATLIGVPVGVWSAWRFGSWLDRLIMAGAVLGFSLPAFVGGYLLAYVFGVKLKLLPVQGYASLGQGFGPWLEHLILPALALSGAYMALIARVTRATVIETLRQDYIRTARAKGGNTRTLLRHALRNAATSIVTVIGLGIAILISGTIIIESVFAIPGLGLLTVDSILRHDYPVIQGLVLFFSFAYVLINLLVDLSYSLIDPRIQH